MATTFLTLVYFCQDAVGDVPEGVGKAGHKVAASGLKPETGGMCGADHAPCSGRAKNL